jgi:hypothetical protein
LFYWRWDLLISNKQSYFTPKKILKAKKSFKLVIRDLSSGFSFTIFKKQKGAMLIEFHISCQLSQKECSLLPYQSYWITSKRIVTPQGVISGAGLFTS